MVEEFLQNIKKFNYKMRSRGKSTRWNVFFQYSVFFYNLIIGVLMAPLYIKYIGIQTYGAWLAAGNILGWISVVDPGFGDILQQKIALHYGQNGNHMIGFYASAGIIFSVCISFLILLICIIIYPYVSKFIGINDVIVITQVNQAFLISGLGVALTFASFSFAGINLGLLGSFGAGMIYTISNIVSILTIYYLLVNNQGVLALAYGLALRGAFYLLSNIFFTIYIFRKEKIKLKIDKLIFMELSRLSIYNFLGRISSTLTTQTNYFFITKYLSPTISAIFKFNTTPVENSKVLLVRPSNALIPALSNLYGSGSLNIVNTILFNYFVFLIWGMGIVFSGFVIFTKPFLELWIGKGMYVGLGIILIICFNLVVSSVNQIASNILFSIGDIKENNIALTIKSSFYILILIPAIIHFQLIGIVGSMLVIELIVFFFYYFREIIKKIKIDRLQLNTIIKESINVVVVVSIIVFIKCFFFDINIARWIDFIIQIFSFVSVYFLSLYYFSKRFRMVCMIIIRNRKFNLKDTIYDS